ncbi:MAG: histidine kinase dimerization/phospho-acceptor domain-containing protein [Gemmatimonadaceae bacterium]
MVDSESDESAADCKERLARLKLLAARLQHDINNPLTALLAEAQMLALDERLPQEHSAEVEQIVELARRVAAVVRKLDSLRGEPAPR